MLWGSIDDPCRNWTRFLPFFEFLEIIFYSKSILLIKERTGSTFSFHESSLNWTFFNVITWSRRSQNLSILGMRSFLTRKMKPTQFFAPLIRELSVRISVWEERISPYCSKLLSKLVSFDLVSLKLKLTQEKKTIIGYLLVYWFEQSLLPLL